MQKPRKFARGVPTNAERDMVPHPFTKTEFRRFRKSHNMGRGHYRTALSIATINQKEFYA